MTKIQNLWLMAALVCSLSLSISSCKDDDNKDDGSSPTDAEATVNEQSNMFWNVVGQLVGTGQACDDYQNKTFLPIIGEPKDGNETIREVLTNSEEAAARRFADLVTVGDGLPVAIDENTQTYTWSDPEVGTLVYTKSTDGKSLATVDVNIKQIPGLRQIVYLTAEQQGKNASFGGTAFYRFGDIVMREHDNNDIDFWICVRPAFGKEDKGDSHWICISKLPANNLWSWTSPRNNETYVLPTKLGTSEEHMQNLAEMLYAIYNPDLWRQHITDHSSVNIFGRPKGLPIFHDFHSTNVKYHAPLFWKRVAESWKERHVEQYVFGLSPERLSELVNNGHLYFLANGYSWKVGSSPTLYQYRYSSGTKDTELNMHKQEYKKVSKNVINPVIPLDCRTTGERPYVVNEDFFGDEHPRFIIRFATGKELMGTNPGRYQSMDGVNGLKDYYVYNKHYKIAVGENNSPEILQDFIGESHYKLFDVYKDEEGCRWFPIYQSGRDDYSPEENYRLDHSAYTYFISFDGLKYSENNLRAVNLPSQELAIKAMTWLWQMVNNGLVLKNLNDNKFFGDVYTHLIENAGFDPRHILKAVYPPDSDNDAWSVYSACVGYSDDADTDPKKAGKQKLIRWIDYPSGERRVPTLYIWTHYPSKSNSQPDYPISFDDKLIYLQDIVNDEIIDDRAEDPFVVRKVSLGFYKNMHDACINEPLSDGDPRAAQVSNYAYNMDAWNKFTQPLSMWREPVLLFRVTRVFDGGNDDFETTTDDGHKLKLYRQASIYTPTDEDEANTISISLNALFGFLAGNLNAMWLDGQHYTTPVWYQDIINR